MLFAMSAASSRNQDQNIRCTITDAKCDSFCAASGPRGQLRPRKVTISDQLASLTRPTWSSNTHNTVKVGIGVDCRHHDSLEQALSTTFAEGKPSAVCALISTKINTGVKTVHGQQSKAGNVAVQAIILDIANGEILTPVRGS